MKIILLFIYKEIYSNNLHNVIFAYDECSFSSPDIGHQNGP